MYVRFNSNWMKRIADKGLIVFWEWSKPDTKAAEQGLVMPAEQNFTVPCISLGEGFLQVLLQRLPEAGDLLCGARVCRAALRHVALHSSE